MKSSGKKPLRRKSNLVNMLPSKSGRPKAEMGKGAEAPFLEGRLLLD